MPRRFSLLSIPALLISLFIITAVSAVVLWLRYMDHLPENMTYDDLLHGRILPLFFAQSVWTWRESTSFNALNSFVDIKTSMSCLGLILGVCLFCLKINCRFLYFGYGCIGVGLAHYLAGMFVLSKNTEPSNCGRWLAVMLLGMLYSAIACLFFTILDICRIDSDWFSNRAQRKTATNIIPVQKDIKENSIPEDSKSTNISEFIRN